jgi:hypothetical protein
LILIAFFFVAPHNAHAQQEPAAHLAGAVAPISAILAPSPEAPGISTVSGLTANALPASAESLTPEADSPGFSSSIATAEPLSSLSQAAPDAPAANPKPRKHTPESEIAIEGMVSYGNWQIFAAGIDESLYTAGVEYDRHSWGKFIGAQMDYAADFMPLVLLKEPAVLNEYGVRRSRPGDNKILPGIAFSPIGLRMQWRHDKPFKPYMTVLGGAIGFTQKALSPYASYYDFTLHETVGFYLRMTERVDMRFGLFGDFHFSNAYITTFNPGLDVMNSNLAVSYHFGG